MTVLSGVLRYSEQFHLQLTILEVLLVNCTEKGNNRFTKFNVYLQIQVAKQKNSFKGCYNFLYPINLFLSKLQSEAHWRGRCEGGTGEEEAHRQMKSASLF